MMTQEEIALLLNERIKEIEKRHAEHLQAMESKIDKLENALSNMRKALAARITKLGG